MELCYGRMCFGMPNSKWICKLLSLAVNSLRQGPIRNAL